MGQVAIYLNFMGNAEEAFNHYRKACQTEFSNPLIRFKDAPQGGAPLSADEENKVAHVALPLPGGVQLMATDMLESRGQKLVQGNNFTISLSPDTKEEADRLFNQLSDGGADAIAPHDEFWGYWGTCKDRFGISWMFNIMKQY